MPSPGHPGQLCSGTRRQQQPPQPGHWHAVVRARARQRFGQSHCLCPRARDRGGDGRWQTLPGARRHFGRFAQDPASCATQPRPAHTGRDGSLQTLHRQRPIGYDGGTPEYPGTRRLGTPGLSLTGHHPQPAGQFTGIRGADFHRRPQDERGIDLWQHCSDGPHGR